MARIAAIQPEQIPAAKRVILSVARGIFGWPETLEESIRLFEERGELRDVDDPQANYVAQDGLFLVALDGERVIGTGAIRRLDDETAELKRLWLLEDYQGQGIGYQLAQALLAHATERGYRRVRLQTDVKQTRAQWFYARLGFLIAPGAASTAEDVVMELRL